MIKVLLVLLLIFVLYVVFGVSNKIKVRKDTIKTLKVSKEVKLAVISDLHAFMFGSDYDDIFNILKEEKIDAVLLPGDIFDNNERIVNSYRFITLLKDYKSYFSLGNHEYRILNFNEAIKVMKDNGVHYLFDEKESFNDEVDIIGIKDAWRENRSEEETAKIVNNLIDKNKFNILLSHRPNYIKLYENSNADLVISGHTHGGQWRIPFLDIPVYGPDQGVFPKYAKGIHKKGNSLCYVSAGLATGRIYLPRLYNPSEVGIITILPE